MSVAAGLAALLLASAVLLSTSSTRSCRRRLERLAGTGAGSDDRDRSATARAGRFTGTRFRPVRRAGTGSLGATAVDVPVPVLLDLVAAGVEAGLPPPRALTLVASCIGEAGDVRDGALSGPGPSGVGPEPLARALELSARTGIAPVELIRGAAAEQRRRVAAAQIEAARRLAVLVVLPTGLCLLPAFVLLTVVPLVLDLLRGP